MLDRLDLNMKGHIQVHKGEELIFEEHNQIMPKALLIILNSLDATRNIGINKLHVVTSAGEVKKDITTTLVNPTSNSVTFTTVLLETDFNGYINSLYLRSEPVGLLVGGMSGELPNFSGKTGLNILKDGNTRLKISWEITINKL